MEEFDDMLNGKLNIIIFSFLPKTGSVGPVEQQIKLVLPKEEQNQTILKTLCYIGIFSDDRCSINFWNCW